MIWVTRQLTDNGPRYLSMCRILSRSPPSMLSHWQFSSLGPTNTSWLLAGGPTPPRQTQSANFAVGVVVVQEVLAMNSTSSLHAPELGAFNFVESRMLPWPGNI